MAAAQAEGRPALRAKLLAWQGVFAFALGDAEAAADRQEASLALLLEAERRGEEVRAQRAFALLQLARVRLGQGAKSAGELGARSLELYRELESAAGTAEALGFLGEAAMRRGDGQSAEKLLGQSLARYRMMGDLRGVAGQLPMLSVLAMHATRFEEASELARESYVLCRQAGNAASVAGGLGLLGMSQFWLGRFAEARSLFEESLHLHEELGNRQALAQAHAYVGLASLRLGRYEETRLQAERGLALGRDLDDRAMAGWCLWILGCSMLGLGRFAEAEALFEESASAYRQTGQDSELAWSLAVRACAERALLRPDQARRTLREVFGAAIRLQNFPAVILALPTAALLMTDLGGEARAVELLALMTRYPVVANCSWFEDIALRRLRKVASGLPAEVCREAQARGRALDLWETASVLPRELDQLRPGD